MENNGNPLPTKTKIIRFSLAIVLLIIVALFALLLVSPPVETLWTTLPYPTRLTPLP